MNRTCFHPRSSGPDVADRHIQCRFLSQKEAQRDAHSVYVSPHQASCNNNRMVSNSSFENKGCQSLGEVYLSFPRGLRGKEQSRNSEYAGSRIPGYCTRFACMAMAVHVGIHESGGLLFRDGQELFNDIQQDAADKQPWLPRLRQYVRALPPYKLHKNGQISMDEGYEHTGPGSFLFIKHLHWKNQTRQQVINSWNVDEGNTRENPHFTNYWSREMLLGWGEGQTLQSVVWWVLPQPLLLALDSAIPLYRCPFIVQHAVLFSECLLCPMFSMSGIQQ